MCDCNDCKDKVWCDVFNIPDDTYRTAIIAFLKQCRDNDLEHIVQTYNSQTFNDMSQQHKRIALYAGISFTCFKDKLEIVKVLFSLYCSLRNDESPKKILADSTWLLSICRHGCKNVLQWMIDQGLVVTHWFCYDAWRFKQVDLAHLLLSRGLPNENIDNFFDYNTQLHTKLEWYLNHGLNPSLVPGKIMRAMYEVMAKEKKAKIDKLHQCAMYTGLCRDVMFVCVQFISFDNNTIVPQS